MSQRTSDAWNNAPEEIKNYCQSISKTELEKYRIEQREFKEKYGEEAYERQTRKRKNAERREEEEKRARKGTDGRERADGVDVGEALKVVGETMKPDLTSAAGTAAGTAAASTATAATHANTTLEDLIRSSQQNQLRNLAYQRMYQQQQYLNNPFLSQSMSMPYLGMGEEELLQREVYLRHMLRMRNESLLRGGGTAAMGLLGMTAEGGVLNSSTSAPLTAEAGALANDSIIKARASPKAGTQDESKASSKKEGKPAVNEAKAAASAQGKTEPAVDEAKAESAQGKTEPAVDEGKTSSAQGKTEPAVDEAKAASAQDKAKPTQNESKTASAPSATEITSAVDEAVLRLQNVNKSTSTGMTSSPTLNQGALANGILAQELNFRRRLEEAIQDNAAGQRVDVNSLGDIQNRLALGSTNLQQGMCVPCRGDGGTDLQGLRSSSTQGSNTIAQDDARLARAIQEERIATALRLRELEMSEQLARAQSGGMYGLGVGSFRNMLAQGPSSLQGLRGISGGNHPNDPQSLDPNNAVYDRTRNIQQIEQRMLLLQEQMRREQEQYLLQMNQANALQRTLSAGLSREVTNERTPGIGSQYSGEKRS